MNNERLCQGRIYLDLDGVVYPIARAPENDPDVAKLHSFEWWRTSVVHRLGQLSAEIVLSSSWGEAFMQSKIKSPLGELHAIRALSEKQIYRTSKEAVILQDLQAHPVERVVWVDDAISEDSASTLRAAANDPLVIIPEKTTGLTAAEIASIETYLRK